MLLVVITGNCKSSSAVLSGTLSVESFQLAFLLKGKFPFLLLHGLHLGKKSIPLSDDAVILVHASVILLQIKKITEDTDKGDKDDGKNENRNQHQALARCASLSFILRL